MRIAVVGATGQIGTPTVAALERAGHDVVKISRSAGVDVRSGDGLADALAGAEVVVDVTSTASQDEAEIVDFFGTITRNLLAAGRQAGVGHHVLLSIVGIDHGQRVAHYEGKREQERLVSAGPIPWTIVRATQFYELAGRLAAGAAQDGVAMVAPLLVQPIAPVDVGELLAQAATAAPRNATIDIAGPETQDFVDMARRTFGVQGKDIKLVPTWRGWFDTTMAGEVLLPGAGARLGTTTFEDWLAAGAR